MLNILFVINIFLSVYFCKFYILKTIINNLKLYYVINLNYFLYKILSFLNINLLFYVNFKF